MPAGWRGWSMICSFWSGPTPGSRPAERSIWGRSCAGSWARTPVRTAAGWRAVGDDQVFVRGDERALARAVENLVENALVHGPEGGRVTISVARDDGRALVTVQDEGPGPDPADRDRLFERFWRGAGRLEPAGVGARAIDRVGDRRPPWRAGRRRRVGVHARIARSREGLIESARSYSHIASY